MWFLTSSVKKRLKKSIGSLLVILPMVNPGVVLNAGTANYNFMFHLRTFYTNITIVLLDPGLECWPDWPSSGLEGGVSFNEESWFCRFTEEGGNWSVDTCTDGTFMPVERHWGCSSNAFTSLVKVGNCLLKRVSTWYSYVTVTSGADGCLLYDSWYITVGVH